MLSRNAILTDDHLHVLNTEGVFALGDCATIELHRISDEVHHLFKLADKNKDGALSVEEFEGILNLFFQSSSCTLSKSASQKSISNVCKKHARNAL